MLHIVDLTSGADEFEMSSSSVVAKEVKMSVEQRLPDYPYEPLGKEEQCIRLIHVLSVHETEGIACTMRTVSLNDRPVYQCLSYTWGNPLSDSSPDSGENYPLLCDGAYLPTTVNLRRALRHLWECAKEELDGIWIDALCINQSDNGERSQQVGMMTEIYRSARYTVVWLGQEEADTHRVYEVMRVVLEHDKRYPGYFERLVDAGSIEAAGGPDPPEITPAAWVSCDKILRRPYFRRAWIIQEVVVSRDLVAFCGTKKLEWTTLVMLSQMIPMVHPAFAALHALQQPLNMGVMSDTGSNPNTLHQLRVGFERDKILNYAVFQALALVVMRTSFQATNRRDMIFSLKGICDVMGQIVVNYDRSVGQVFADFSWVLLQRERGLRILAEVECRPLVNIGPPRDETAPSIPFEPRPNDPTELPSWVPDFSAYAMPSSWIRRYEDCFSAGIQKDEGRSSAGKASSHHVSVARSQDCLRVQGVQFDTITATGESYEEVNISNSIARLVAVLSQLPQSYIGQETDRIEAFWRTITIGNPHDKVYPAPSEAKLVVSQWLLHQLGRCRIAVDLGRLRPRDWEESLSRVAHLAASDSTGLFPKGGQLHNYYASLSNHYSRLPLRQAAPENGPVTATAAAFGNSALNNMRLFLTTNKYLGKGYHTIKAGDEVWILQGAEIPYVLRPTETGRYRLVGQSYVHGIMHGEALANVQFHTIEIE